MSELKDVAERVLDDPLRDVYHIGDADLDALVCNAQQLADAYLAEHDSAPLDDAGLRECGFQLTGGEWWHKTVLGSIVKNGDTWEWYVDEIFACRIATRGQLRRLTSVLEGE